MDRQNWTRDQLIVAFNLYCKIPFAKAVKSNPAVIEIARLIGRTPSAVAFKLGNFGSFDPELKKRGIGGLPNASKLDKQIWDEFHDDWDELAFQSEKLLATYFQKGSIKSEHSYDDFPPGVDRDALARVRVNQSFFRQSVLGIYRGECCVTGLAVQELLVASHIVPWAIDQGSRTNPQNGLCLNALHDRAFDRGLITITTDYRIKVSRHIQQSDKSPTAQQFIIAYDGKPIALPDKFLPSATFLRYHNEEVFLG